MPLIKTVELSKTYRLDETYTYTLADINLSIEQEDEKKQELALMKAIGISQRSIAKMVLYESVILSLLGGIMGILLSRLGQEVLNISAYRFFGAGQVSVVNPALQLGGVVIALAAGVLSRLIPVIMTKRIDLSGTPG